MLSAQATQFAEDLTRTVRAVAVDCDPFTALLMTKNDGTRKFTVRQHPVDGIVLRVNGEPLLQLSVSFQRSLDGAGRYLAVDDAKIKVHAQGDRQPLFRYEYDRDAVADMPAAHIQLHAHRDAFSHVMNRAGRASARGKRRAGSNAVPRLEELHFPVGGHRFRPCLEDVLEMLALELGVDATPEGLEALRSGRERWRRSQVGAVVRDAPEEAIRVLTDLGYRVRLGSLRSRPAERTRRLRDL
ncbi:hypothetical protein [Nocardioides sp. GY 10127]|uniref:hypothetical protein n=1 Tax=Nocardioides sp. GY 10127 TaxID=2569762 RepID=UPI0010A91D5B|nr:hypothetical protein [Nocardioides sp. GY 10127]TIC79410.1 hypothetical protein E8D37_17685 [Nocardioides sp. GY 10127]